MIRKNKTWLLVILPLAAGITAVIFLLPSSCKKEASLPWVTTRGISNVTEISASCSYEVNSDGGATVTERGVCWRTGETPDINDSKTMDGEGTGFYISELTGLSPNTNYFARAYATNSVGSVTSNVVQFHTRSGTVSDNDGNVYPTVIIGAQEWIGENLRTTKLNNGDPIQLLDDPMQWENTAGPAYGWYENKEEEYKNSYGAVYNGHAAVSGRLCPVGWHVPTATDWTHLTDYLGGYSVAGGKMKEFGIVHWTAPNTGATNESGFLALPGGNLFSVSSGCISVGFSGMKAIGSWWSVTQTNGMIETRTLDFDTAGVYVGSVVITDGQSVRCVKN